MESVEVVCLLGWGAGSQCWEQPLAAIKIISSIDIVLSCSSYLFAVCLLTVRPRRVWEIVIGVLPLMPQVTGFWVLFTL